MLQSQKLIELIGRALQPDYADGISTPRRTHENETLPSARKISTKIHRPSYSSDPNFTVMLAVFGQFLDHDITATALNQGFSTFVARTLCLCVKDIFKPNN